MLVYNLLILGSILYSGLAMYVLARHFTGSPAGALVAGTIFAFVTFRFDHYHHLELQATVFMPLAVWFLDRACERRRWADMAGFGACLVLQLLSGIYYTIFLATAFAVVIPVRWFRLETQARWRCAGQLVVVGALRQPHAPSRTCPSTCRTATPWASAARRNSGCTRRRR